MSRPRVMVVADVGLVSWGIETGGGWSHMANVLADDSIIDARSDSMKFPGGLKVPAGVQRRPAGYLDSIRKWVVLEGPEDDPGGKWSYNRWEYALVSQLKKPYDFIGIWDFLSDSVIDRNWRDESAWFCDELAVWAQEKAGYVPQLPEPVFRITPSAALLFDIGAGWRVVAGRG